MNILMCRPDHFDIEYEINPWMQKSVKVNQAAALEQWSSLRDLYESLGATITLTDQPEGVPDLVFSANAGLVWKERAVVSRFQHPERQGEEPYWRTAFKEAGLTVLEIPDGYAFEGAGDGLFVGSTLFFGYGPRTDPAVHEVVASLLDVEYVSLQLVNPNFYHLDTCFCPLNDDAAIFLPSAFTAEGIAELQRRIPTAIPVPQSVADGFGCNALVIGENVVATPAIEEITDDLASVDLVPKTVPMSEFMKSGGGARCLSLPLDIGMPSYAQVSHSLR